MNEGIFSEQVWGKYAEKLDDFLLPANRQSAVNCCNELVLNAIPHALDSLSLYPNVSDLSCQKMAGVAFIMGTATLELCYNNEKVFTSAVKLRKGEAAWIYDNCSDFVSVLELARYYFCKLKVKIEGNEGLKIALLDKCIKKCDELISEY